MDTAIQNYLNTLTSREPERSHSFLKEIQAAHVRLFPFNNLAVLLGEEIKLDAESLFSKVIEQKRGGYCFEQNGIFFLLLQELGFSPQLILARVLNNRDIDAPRTHRITLLELENKEYILDVGFGPHCPREPLLLRSTQPQIQGSDTYRIVETAPNKFQLQIVQDDEWFVLYQFDLANYTEADCTVGNFYSYRHPRAVFVNNLIVSKRSDETVFIRNSEFIRIMGDSVNTVEIEAEEHLNEILIREFDISLTKKQLSAIFAVADSKRK